MTYRMRQSADVACAELSAYGLHLTSRHRLTISPGVIWANSNYMESTFGIDSLQSQAEGLPTHGAHAGVEYPTLGVDWEWEINNRFSLSTNATALRLMGDAASRPLVKQRTGGVYSTTLSYRF
jgi:MipA family protein